MLHKLKIEENYLKNLIDGRKKAEIRFNDRDYQIGDILQFIDYSKFDHPESVFFEITHIHSGLGLQDRYVVLSVKNCHSTTKQQ